VTADFDTLLRLDRALDELAAAGGAPPSAPARSGAPAAEAETAALAALAAGLREAVPAPQDAEVAARGRAALLAAAAVPARPGRRDRRGGPARRGEGARRGATVRRRLALVLAAALLAVALPAAAAGQARPGTPLWPLRQAGQQARLGLTADPVERAHLRLNTAAMLLAAARDGDGYRQEGLVRCRDQVEAALAQLGGRSGPRAAAERARAEELLGDLDALEQRAGDDQRRTGDDEQERAPGPAPGDDHSGPGGGRSGPGGGGGSGESGSD
jgi:translation initiation factor IF-2